MRQFTGARWWISLIAVAVCLCGCATTQPVDWSSRVGTFTYDQAVVELGPPDKSARLTDGSTVADWLTRRGYSEMYSASGYGFYSWNYGGFYPAFVDSYHSPDYFLRLVFGSDNVLKSWKKYSR